MKTARLRQADRKTFKKAGERLPGSIEMETFSNGRPGCGRTTKKIRKYPFKTVSYIYRTYTRLRPHSAKNGFPTTLNL